MAAFLHFFFLSSFCWVLTEAWQSYMAVTGRLRNRLIRKRFLCLGWGEWCRAGGGGPPPPLPAVPAPCGPVPRPPPQPLPTVPTPLRSHRSPPQPLPSVSAPYGPIPPLPGLCPRPRPPSPVSARCPCPLQPLPLVALSPTPCLALVLLVPPWGCQVKYDAKFYLNFR